MTKEDVDSKNDADAETADETTAVDAADETDETATDESEASEVKSTAEEAPGLDDSEDASERPTWVRYAVAGAIAAVLVGALVVSGIFGWKVWRVHQVDVAGEQAQAVAVPYTEILTSIDTNSMDDNFRQILNGSTGELKQEFTKASVQLRQLLVDNKAAAHGKVVNSAIVSKTPNKVVLLLMVDQSITNTQLPDPRIDRSRMRITMEKIDGRWLASKLEYL
ncbi:MULTISPECIES: DUF3329 domain-containing protein [unclassified Mycobacteroides]|uniref:DUF3329 domain-containing protein n=1 Tax=unclassified Mycobacteroides TaxID=2618759 RepID=UPI0012DDDEEF